ncbi:hypothetical protein Rumeso_01390 [Rubellimicrobium mesophilum DSM 19309]|uniref:Uncharacterized protein n=1 Tax=Rubellimicrobium mesophilum DSM 19309 TaxID=442562 RepID=A0A017HRS2_9RHOB|nr:hypothetical protein Rumeso_01390 [Rubellimicrobium mesophilum DSM 19309]
MFPLPRMPMCMSVLLLIGAPFGAVDMGNIGHVQSDDNQG